MNQNPNNNENVPAVEAVAAVTSSSSGGGSSGSSEEDNNNNTHHHARNDGREEEIETSSNSSRDNDVSQLQQEHSSEASSDADDEAEIENEEEDNANNQNEDHNSASSSFDREENNPDSNAPDGRQSPKADEASHGGSHTTEGTEEQRSSGGSAISSDEEDEDTKRSTSSSRKRKRKHKRRSSRSRKRRSERMNQLSSLQESIQAMEERNKAKRDMIQQIRQDLTVLNRENDQMRREIQVWHSLRSPQDQHFSELFQAQLSQTMLMSQQFQPQPQNNLAHSTALALAKAASQPSSGSQKDTQGAMPPQKEAAQPLVLSQNAHHSEILCFVEQFLRQKQQQRQTSWQPHAPSLPPQLQAQLPQNPSNVEASLTPAQVEGLQRRAALLRQLAERIASQPRNPPTHALSDSQPTRQDIIPQQQSQIPQEPYPANNTMRSQHNSFQALQNPQYQPGVSGISRSSDPGRAQSLSDRNRAAALRAILLLIQRREHSRNQMKQGPSHMG